LQRQSNGSQVFENGEATGELDLHGADVPLAPVAHKETTMNFRVVLGDWSDDGHGKTKEVAFRCTATSMREVEKAYSAAMKKVPKAIYPDEVCSEHGDSSPSAAQQSLLESLGGPAYNGDRFLWMSELLAWFINKGNPALEVEILPELPRLNVGGSFGYGFWD
jgi:hypothetical protein